MALAKRLLLNLLLIATLSAQADRYGRPACDAGDQEFADRTYFLLCHNSSRKVSTWVGYELKPEHLRGQARRSGHFRRDTALLGPGAHNDDYTHSGFSRGHLAPAADFSWDADAMRATFLLTNAVPQNQKMNAGLWASLERCVRRLASGADAVYIFTGPLFEGEIATIGAGRVAVPSHLFKAILVEKDGHRSMYAAIIPNSAQDAGETLSHYLTSLEEVEKRTGLHFFPALEDTERRSLESVRSPLPE